MSSFSLERLFPILDSIRALWVRHAARLMGIAIVLLTILAVLKLGDELRRMFWDFETGSSYDLKGFYQQVRVWFSGRSIYAEFIMTVYPPASLVMWYPFLGWLPLDQVRWLWTAAIAAALAWSVYLVIKYSGAETRAERILVALLLLAMNATGVVYGTGQWILYMIPFLLIGLFSLQNPVSWQRDIIAAVCLTLTLIKPNISAPFFWLVLFSSGGWRILTLTAAGYTALTLFAVSFQTTPLPVLINQWLGQISSIAATQGYGNISIWVSNLGFDQWALSVSLLALIAVGIWTFSHRAADLWLLLGVLAITARMWTYHEHADNVLILFPMIALFRIAKRGSSVRGADVMAGLLLAATMLMMLLPAQIRFFSWPQNSPFLVGHPLIWIIVLVFLIVYTRAELGQSHPASNYQSQGALAS